MRNDERGLYRPQTLDISKLSKWSASDDEDAGLPNERAIVGEAIEACDRIVG